MSRSLAFAVLVVFGLSCCPCLGLRKFRRAGNSQGQVELLEKHTWAAISTNAACSTNSEGIRSTGIYKRPTEHKSRFGGEFDGYSHFKVLFADGKVIAVDEGMPPFMVGWTIKEISGKPYNQAKQEGLIELLSSGYVRFPNETDVLFHWPLFTLEMCQDRCVGSHCVAIDYFTSTGECLTYHAACTTPQATRDGASSYVVERQDTWVAISTNAACSTNSEGIRSTGIYKRPTEHKSRFGGEFDGYSHFKVLFADGKVIAVDEGMPPFMVGWTIKEISGKPYDQARQEGLIEFLSSGYVRFPDNTDVLFDWPLFTLEMCKGLCNDCVAIDYFASTGECLTYGDKGTGRPREACTTPQATRDGASSYARTCVSHSCPRGYVLKANAGNILGQGSDAACCEVCPVSDCGCAVRDAVARNSAWRRWDGVTCKCAAGTSLHGDSEFCVGRKFDPVKLWGHCFCSHDMPSGEVA